MAAALPLEEVDLSFNLPTGGNIYTPTGGTVASPADIGSLVSSALPGDIIYLEPGGVYQFSSLRNIGSGTDTPCYIISTAHGSLPAPGERVSPADVGNMAVLIAKDSRAPDGAFDVGYGAGPYRIVGCHIYAENDATVHNQLVWYDSLTEAVILDRCWIQGTTGTRKGLGTNGRRCGFVGLYVNNFFGSGAGDPDNGIALHLNTDRTAEIVTVDNCYFEGSAAGIAIGEALGRADVTPKDITIRNCDVTKNPAWEGVYTSIYANIDIREGQRILIEACDITNNWEESTTGNSGFGFAVRDPYATGEASNVAEDITFRLSRIKDCHAGILFKGSADYANAGARRIDVDDIIIEAIPVSGRGDGHLFEFINGLSFSPDDVEIRNVSAFILTGTGQDIGDFTWCDNTPEAANLIFINCIGDSGINGLKGPGTQPGTPSLGANFNPYTFDGNVIIGAIGVYPAGNDTPADRSIVQFTNFAAGDYRLEAGSPYKNGGTDGNDPGADIEAVWAALGISPPVSGADVNMVFNDNAIVSFEMQVSNVPETDVDLQFRDNTITSFEMLAEQVIVEADVDVELRDNTINSFVMEVIGETAQVVNLTFNDMRITSYDMEVVQQVTVDLEFNSMVIASYDMEVGQGVAVDVEFRDMTIASYDMEVGQGIAVDVDLNDMVITSFVMEASQGITSDVNLIFNNATIQSFDLDVVQTQDVALEFRDSTIQSFPMDVAQGALVSLLFNNNAILSYPMDVANTVNVPLQFNDGTIESFQLEVQQGVATGVNLEFKDATIQSFTMEIGQSYNVDLQFNDAKILSYELEVEQGIAGEARMQFNDNRIQSFDLQVADTFNLDLQFNDSRVTSYDMEVIQQISTDVNLLFNANDIISFELEVVQGVGVQTQLNDNTIESFELEAEQIFSTDVNMLFNNNSITSFPMGITLPELFVSRTLVIIR